MTISGNRILVITLGIAVILTVLMAIIAIAWFIHEDSLPPLERAKIILNKAPLIDG